MSVEWDVLVIGAGPAGACAAWSAARRGARTLLVDRAAFPREKVCGCCINAGALGVIDAMGLGDEIRALGARDLRTLELHAGGRCARVELSGGVALSRGALDTALVRCAERAGAVFLDSHAARVRSRDGGRVVGLRAGGAEREVRAAVVIVADGLAGVALDEVAECRSVAAAGSFIGLGARVSVGGEPGVVRMYCGSGGYLGMVELEGGETDVAAAADPAVLRAAGGPARWASALVRDAGAKCAAELSLARWSGTPLLTRERAVLELDGLLIAGDAAGYVEPFTGEGISWAMRAGDRAGELASRGVLRRGEWTRWWRRELGARRAACGVVRACLREPVLTEGVVRIASVWPWLGGRIAGAFGARFRAGGAA